MPLACVISTNLPAGGSNATIAIAEHTAMAAQEIPFKLFWFLYVR